MTAGPNSAAATMHTTGQSIAMAENGSGVNALDRGLEAVALAAAAMGRVPAHATWTEGGRGEAAGRLHQAVPARAAWSRGGHLLRVLPGLEHVPGAAGQYRHR